MRAALRDAANVMRDEARRSAPVISATSLAVRKGYRKPGTVRKAIGVMSARSAPGTVAVRLKVRCANPGQQGAKSPNDQFYARWLETGTKQMRAFGMLQGRRAARPARRWRSSSARYRRACRSCCASSGRGAGNLPGLAGINLHFAKRAPGCSTRLRRLGDHFSRTVARQCVPPASHNVDKMGQSFDVLSPPKKMDGDKFR